MTAAKFRIIVVTENSDVLRRIKPLVRDDGADVYWEKDLDSLLDLFQEETFDLIIITSDTFLAHKVDGEQMLELLREKSPVTRILFLIGADGDETEIAELKSGSYHFGPVQSSDDELRELIKRALDDRPREGRNLLLRKNSAKQEFEQLLGQSAPMQKLFKQIRRASSVDIPVLLQGETGTGKDLAARAIHDASDRAAGPFIPIHLGALPGELVGSELFGHVKGAFTGASASRKGKFELGEGGTVFLDEIATLDESVQIHLLRLLETRSFYKLGGKREIKVDVRVIAATNEELGPLVEQGKFREDLFYRLDVFPIELPPLREREGDLELLAREFCSRFSGKFEKRIESIDPLCYELMRGHEWPGNVRELKNVIQRAVLVCNEPVLLPEHLPPRFHDTGKQLAPATVNGRETTAGGDDAKIVLKVGSSLEEMEREIIVRTLEQANQNRKRTAEILGISRRSLYNKLAKYDIK